MAPVIENWTDLFGTVREIGPAAIEGFAALAVDVESVADVADFASLLSDMSGGTVQVSAPSELVDELGLLPGDRIRCRTRTAGRGRLFAHPNGIEILA